MKRGSLLKSRIAYYVIALAISFAAFATFTPYHAAYDAAFDAYDAAHAAYDAASDAAAAAAATAATADAADAAARSAAYTAYNEADNDYNAYEGSAIYDAIVESTSAAWSEASYNNDLAAQFADAAYFSFEGWTDAVRDAAYDADGAAYAAAYAVCVYAAYDTCDALAAAYNVRDAALDAWLDTELNGLFSRPAPADTPLKSAFIAITKVMSASADREGVTLVVVAIVISLAAFAGAHMLYHRTPLEVAKARDLI